MVLCYARQMPTCILSCRSGFLTSWQLCSKMNVSRGPGGSHVTCYDLVSEIRNIFPSPNGMIINIMLQEKHVEQKILSWTSWKIQYVNTTSVI